MDPLLSANPRTCATTWRTFFEAATGRVPAELLRDAWLQMVDIAWIDAFMERGRKGALGIGDRVLARTEERGQGLIVG